MLRKRFCLVLLILFGMCPMAWAGPMVHDWSQRFGDASLQYAYSVDADGSGNVVATGVFADTVDFGGGLLMSAGNYDIFVVKFDAAGNHVWSKRFGEASMEYAYSVAADDSGSVIVAGWFYDTVDFGGGLLTSAGNSDICVAKFDAAGNHVWSKRFGDAGTEVAYDVAADGSGNIVVVGRFEGTIDFGGGLLTSAGDSDIYVAKFDAAGNHVWSKRFGEASTQYAHAVEVDGSENVIVTGWFHGSVDFGGGLLTSAGNADIYVAKFDAAGDHVWSERFGDAHTQYCYSNSVDGSGNVVVTGEFCGTVDFGGGLLTSAGDSDIYVAKFDAAGNHAWSERFGDAGTQSAYSAAVDGSGSVILTGWFYGTVDFGGGLLTSTGTADIFIAEFDAAGTHVWSQRFGDASDQVARSAAVDGSGNVVVTGGFYGTLDFGGGALTSAGDYDICIAKFQRAWIDVTNGPLGDLGQSRGVAWGDYDNDGNLDIYVSNTLTDANKLFHNEGGEVFSDATSGPMGDTGNGMGIAWGDYDNDGDLDLYLSNGGTDANKLFRNEGGGAFVDATSGPLANADGGQGIAWGDYDNDGNLDLYLAIGGGNPNKLFRNDGEGTFVDATSGPLGDTESSVNAVWGDYDNDGDLDLYLSNVGTDASKLLRNDGSGVFSNATSAPLGNTGTGAGVAWGDYDNDGDLDLYLANWGTSNKLFRNEGAGTFVDATSGLLGDPGQSRGVAWGDYDNDGDLDLFVSNWGTPSKLFRNDGGGAFVDATSGPLGDVGSCTGAAWGDYDSDGDLDLYVARYSQANRLFRNNLSSGNHWLHVDLEGVYSNRAGIGARIRVVTGGASQIREVSGGSGDMSQNSLTAEFGLGGATVVDTVCVLWPSGIAQDSLNVAVDQLIVITEQESPVGVIDGSDAPVVDFLSQSHPNPFNPLARITFSVAVPGEVALRVYDISGRPVRTLVDGWREARRYGIAWDGRDDQGNAVASGVYFYKLDAPGYTESKKMVLLR
jgi:hypothetical protein